MPSKKLPPPKAKAKVKPAPQENTVFLILRVSPGARKKFAATCEKAGKTMSTVLRTFIAQKG